MEKLNSKNKKNDAPPDVEDTGKNETNSLAEMDEYKRKFVEALKKQQEGLSEHASSTFMMCLIFKDDAQVEEFMRITGLLEKSEKYYNPVFFNGEGFSDKIGFSVKKRNYKKPAPTRNYKSLNRFIVPPYEQ